MVFLTPVNWRAEDEYGHEDEHVSEIRMLDYRFQLRDSIEAPVYLLPTIFLPCN